MGLTAAESFMLICFVLLLMLGLWRQSFAEKLATSEAFHNSFTPNQRSAALAYRDQLSDLGQSLAKVEDYRGVMESAGSPKTAQDAIDLYQQVSQYPPGEVLERVRLLDEQALAAMTKAAVQVPKDTLRQLTDMMRIKDFPEDIAILSAMAQSMDLPERLSLAANENLSEDLAELNAYRKTGLVPDEINTKDIRDLIAYRDTGLSPDEVEAQSSTLSQLQTAQTSAVSTGADVAAEIKRRAGEAIARLGGQILPTGTVTFPEGVLFDQGKSEIKPRFNELLSQFCRPWFEILHDFDASLDTAQIEGHASSDWADLPPDKAFIANLALSQQRAAVVFERCLSYGGNDEITDWARSRLAAVGYSSSRPVLADGKERPDLSRRVAFAVDTKTADEEARAVLDSSTVPTPDVSGYPAKSAKPARDDIAKELLKLPDGTFYKSQGYKEIFGKVTHVSDGDTLSVGGQKIRLEGLHAPELKDPMGPEAKTQMTNIALGQDAVCWLSGKMTYNRMVGTCFVGGKDISGALVAAGLGRDCTSLSDGRYQALERFAIDREIGNLPGYCN